MAVAVASDVEQDDDRAARVLRHRLSAALLSDEQGRLRLGQAQTSVCFWITDLPSASATLLLDRTPPTVLAGDEPAELVLAMTLAQARELAHGRLIVSLALIAGEITGSGQPRRFLAVEPVLRNLLREL